MPSRKNFPSVLFFIAGLILFPQILFASTDVSGILSSDTLWTSSNSPYVVHGTVVIPSGVTLSIDPGVLVQFDNGASIVGLGRIVAQGSLLQKIIFTSLDPTLSGGQGLLGANGWSIDLGTTGSSATFGPFDFEHIIVEHSNGISLSRGQVTLRDVTVRDSDVGFRLLYSPNILIDGMDISNVAGPMGITASTAIVGGVSVANSGSLGAIFAVGSSDIVFSSTTITHTLLGPAVLLQSSHATSTDLILSGGDGVGISLKNNFSTGPSTLFVASSTIEGFAVDGILNTGSILNLTQSNVRNNGVGIYSQNTLFDAAAFTTASGNSFSGNQNGVVATGFGVPDVRQNFWGDPSGPFHGVQNPGGHGDALSGVILFTPWLTNDPLVYTVPEQGHNPVIIIPGLLGSSQKNGVWVIDPIFHVYDNLLDTLRASGYVDNVDLFTFPYDWRRSNVDTATDLKTKIDSVKLFCGCGTVDLVAHSMGGLVARQYIESPAFTHDVDHLIFLGTPHLGSAKDYLTWEAGESSPDLFSSALRGLLVREAHKAGYPSLFAYLHQKPVPSFQELLPITNYLHDATTTSLKLYPNNAPRNTFLENLNSSISLLLNNSGVNITNIVGDTGTSTINTIRVVPSTTLPLWQDGFPEGFNSSSGDRGLEFGRGDETVTLQSASFINSDLQTVNSEHVHLPTDEEGLIYTRLTGKNPVSLVNKQHLINFKILILKILSPADIVVIAPDGKRMGKDFATGNEFNEIPNAFYSGYATDDEYVTIPDPLDGDYKVVTQGTGNGGEYTIASDLISNATTSEKDFVGQTLPGLISSVTVSVLASSTNPLLVSPDDHTPPSITISPIKSVYLRSESLFLSATSTDDTGIATSSTIFNAKPVSSPGTIDLFFGHLGTSTISFSAQDLMGNVTIFSTTTQVIVTASSTILDVERAFSLGWISSKSVKDDIIAKLKQATKIETKIITLTEQLPGKPKVTKQIQKLEERFDKVLGKALSKDVENKHPKFINDQAYNLLTEDITWLINN